MTAAQPSQPKSASPAGMTDPERQGPASRITVARESKLAGYGLPCSKCRLYYPADMDSCPVCKTAERVSPAAQAAAAAIPAAPQPEPGTQPEVERERLRELKSQIFASHTQINAVATFRCALDQNHNGDVEPAAVCHSCYGDLRQQTDRMEAALHMDVKEAAQIVYAAVWADTSDPTRTYQNAAAALLAELRQRAGIGLLLGSQQSLTH